MSDQSDVFSDVDSQYERSLDACTSDYSSDSESDDHIFVEVDSLPTTQYSDTGDGHITEASASPIMFAVSTGDASAASTSSSPKLEPVRPDGAAFVGGCVSEAAAAAFWRQHEANLEWSSTITVDGATLRGRGRCNPPTVQLPAAASSAFDNGDCSAESALAAWFNATPEFQLGDGCTWIGGGSRYCDNDRALGHIIASVTLRCSRSGKSSKKSSSQSDAVTKEGRSAKCDCSCRISLNRNRATGQWQIGSYCLDHTGHAQPARYGGDVYATLSRTEHAASRTALSMGASTAGAAVYLAAQFGRDVSTASLKSDRAVHTRESRAALQKQAIAAIKKMDPNERDPRGMLSVGFSSATTNADFIQALRELALIDDDFRFVVELGDPLVGDIVKSPKWSEFVMKRRAGLQTLGIDEQRLAIIVSKFHLFREFTTSTYTHTQWLEWVRGESTVFDAAFGDFVASAASHKRAPASSATDGGSDAGADLQQSSLSDASVGGATTESDNGSVWHQASQQSKPVSHAQSARFFPLPAASMETVRLLWLCIICISGIQCPLILFLHGCTRYQRPT